MMEPNFVLRRLLTIRPRKLAAAGLAVLLMAVSLWLLSPRSRLSASLVRASYDWSQVLLPEPEFTNASVVIVYLDLDSYLRERQNPTEPWSRALHARLLRRLTAAGAKAVVFDIVFSEADTNAAADREFIEALRANGH